METRTLSGEDCIAIERKAGRSIERLAQDGSLEIWSRRLHDFRRKLTQAQFQAAVFDYDGTLLASDGRQPGIDDAIVQHLIRILDSGIPVGIATGRGPSVRHELRQRLPRHLYSRVHIGYYSGAQCGDLGQLDRPDQGEAACEDLAPILGALESLRPLAALTVRSHQIIAQPNVGIAVQTLWQTASGLVAESGIRGLKVVRSCRSVDILAPSISKLRLLAHLRDLYRLEGEILCIGDQGRWPGNDHELLGTPHALSVDQVSDDPDTCWNLGPNDSSGIPCTLHYLERVFIDTDTNLRIEL